MNTSKFELIILFQNDSYSVMKKYGEESYLVFKNYNKSEPNGVFCSVDSIDDELVRIAIIKEIEIRQEKKNLKEYSLSKKEEFSLTVPFSFKKVASEVASEGENINEIAELVMQGEISTKTIKVYDVRNLSEYDKRAFNYLRENNLI